MPVYEFDCLNCGKMFEELVGSDIEKVKCEECGSAKVKRRFSVFGLSSNSKNSVSSSKSSCGSCRSHKCSTCH